MIAYGKTDVGAVRATNQDAYSIEEMSDGNLLLIVCDGMGGANAGNIASQKTVEFVTEYFKRSYRSGMSSEDISKLIKNAIMSANIEVYDMSLKSPDLKGMGTTVVAAVISGEFTVIAHVGDSRAYWIYDSIKLLTRDHSIVQTLIETGKLTPEEARVHPRKNVITRAIGTEENVLVDTSVYPPLGNGQKLLLCSDGLTNYAENSEIKEIFDNNSIDRLPQVLVGRANHNGGGDNITVIVAGAN